MSDRKHQNLDRKLVNTFVVLMDSVCVHSILVFLISFSLSGQNVFADTFEKVVWASRTDSLLPRCDHSFPLGMDYSGHKYDVTIEFPEYELMSEEEAQFYKVDRSDFGSEVSIGTSLGVCRKNGVLDAWFVPVVKRNGLLYKIKSFKWNLSVTPSNDYKYLRTRSAVSDERYALSSVLASGHWAKIRVGDKGVYKLTNSALRSMGFQNPSKVRLFGYGGNRLRETSIHLLTDDLNELPTYRLSDGFLFYAYGTMSMSYNSSKHIFEHGQNPYSAYSYYFLMESDAGEPKSFAVDETSSSHCIDVDEGLDFALYEKDSYSWYQAGTRFFDDYEFSNGSSQTYGFSLPDICDGKSYVSVDMSSSHSGNVQLAYDGKTFGRMSIPLPLSYSEASSATAVFSLEQIAASAKINLTYNSSGKGRLDYISVTYPRLLKMHSSQMNFRNPERVGNIRFRLQGDNVEDVHVWRVSSSSDYSEVPVEIVNGYACAVVDNGRTDEYVAVNVKGSFPSPVFVGKVDNQNLHSLQQADMIIVVPASGNTTMAANRLAELHRTYDGLSVEVVSADKIYNEFSSGTPDATAYRRFMKMLYDRASDESKIPRYLLLFGAGLWDNRMQTSACSSLNPDDYLLCYESYNSFSETESYVLEDYFGFLDDGEGSDHQRNKVDVGIGRITATTAQEANDVVSKIENYMKNRDAGAWKNSILVIADDGNANIHMHSSELVSRQLEQLYPAFRVERVYLDNYERITTSTGNSYPMARSEVSNMLKSGSLMVNYTGHGNPNQLSHESLFLLSDFKAMSSKRLPLWLTAACDVAPFDRYRDNIGETALLNPKGGAIGVIATTRTVFTNYNESFDLLFSKYVFGEDENGRRYSVGDALCQTKNALINGYSDLSCNKLHYVLLGDPALVLGAPRHSVVVDSIAGVPFSQSPNISAGQMVSVVGHVESNDGALMDDFSGVVYPMLYDSEERIVTRNNDNSADTSFVYVARTKKLFAGSDSVAGGRFRFTMPVPLDISYSGLSGLLNTYVVSSDGRTEGHGAFDGFTIGGVDSSVGNDTVGPRIYAYLNYYEFPDGGKTGPSPMFVAELSDESGINAAGNSIGHDLELVIDKDYRQTYNLNGAYQTNIGDYRSGRVVYTIPTMSDGPHNLMFRAWDNMNNSSVTQLNFNVVDGLVPSVFGVRYSTTDNGNIVFVASTDQGTQNVSMRLEVFDPAGRKMCDVLGEDECASGVCSLVWDVSSTTGRVLSGVYVFRLTVGSGNVSSNFSDKIVIVGQ